MSKRLLALVMLRGLASVLSVQNQSKAAAAVQAAIAAIEAGRNVDAHLAEVGAAFEAGAGASWDDINDRIRRETDEFLARGDAAT